MTGVIEQSNRSKPAEIFELAFEVAAVGMGLVGSGGVWTLVNQAFCNLLGYEKEELIGREVKSLTHPDDVGESIRLIGELIEGKIASYQQEKRYIHKSGRIVWALLSTTVAQGPDGGPVVIGQVQDITQRKEAELALRRSEALFRTIGENASDIIFVVRLPDLVTEYASPTFRTLLGHAPSELVGANSMGFIYPEDRAQIVERVREMLNEKSNSHILEVRFLDCGGKPHYMEAHGCAVRNEEGEIEQVVVIARAIEERISAQKKLKAREQQLELLLEELRCAHQEAELFINSVPSILIGMDGEGRIRRWNSTAASTFGLEREEVLGRSLGGCRIHWLSANMEAKARTLLGTKTEAKWEVWFERGGEARQLGLTATWITLPHSEEGELLLVGADITERRQAEEELRYKTAFLEAQTNATLDGILVVDVDNRVILKNRRMPEIFEIPPELSEEQDDETLLKHAMSKVKGQDAFVEQVRYLYSHNEATSHDEIEFKNGTVLDRYSSPVIGKDGTHYGRMWIFRDITKRKRNEHAVRQLSQAVEQSPAAVLITNLEGNITYVNHRFKESTGYSFEEVVGRNPRFLKSGHTSASEYKQMWETIHHGREWRGEFCNKKKNGENYWGSVAITPIKDDHGNPTHFLAIEEDITERKLMESQLRQAQKLEAIGQLAAGIAHEINTPIQFVGDNTQFVKDAWSALDPGLSLLRALSKQGPGEALAPELLDQVQEVLGAVDSDYLRREIPMALDQSLEGIERVARIVQAMKEFSHPGSDEKQFTDINKAILTTLTVARNEWKYVAEIKTILGNELRLVPCYAGELNQVFLNLIINSAHAIAQAMRDGPENKGTITIRTTQDEDWTTISVQDTGVGIPVEIRSRIFEPFFTTKEVGQGTGQGLALAHSSIVRKHGGRIWFESEVGVGTTFYIQLPMAARIS